MCKTGLRQITPEQEEAMAQWKEGDRQPAHMRSLQLFSRGCAYAHNETQSILYAASRGIARSVTFRPILHCTSSRYWPQAVWTGREFHSSKKFSGAFHQVSPGFIDVSRVFIGVSSLHQCQQSSLYASHHESLLLTAKKHLNLRDKLDKSNSSSLLEKIGVDQKDMKFKTDYIILR